MNWLNQQTGIINHYISGAHTGIQPVRVLHPMVLHLFQNANSEFYNDLLTQVKGGKLNNELKLLYGEDPIMTGNGLNFTPRVNNSTRQIEIHETFLSYLWCCSYTVFTLYIQTIDYPTINKNIGRIKYPVSTETIKDANDLFSYAKYIIVDYQPWDMNLLPNPERYDASKREFIERACIIYTEATKFILAHEFTHLKMHVDKVDNNTSISSYLSFEKEADNEAIDIIKKGMSTQSSVESAHKIAMEMGIVIGILSMFFMAAKTTGVRHPDAEDRLTNAIERLASTDSKILFGLACIGLKLWDEQFNLNLTWSNDFNSYEEQYYDIVKQIKARNAK